MATRRGRQQSPASSATEAPAPASASGRRERVPAPGDERAAGREAGGGPVAAMPPEPAGPAGRETALPAVNVGGSATVSAQLWLQESPWRPTAGWAVLAGLLAFGLLMRSFFVDWRTVALALLLVDPLWGSIWRLAGGRDALLPLRRHHGRGSVWLPYLRPGSPAARLLGWGDVAEGGAFEQSVLPLVFRVVLPTLLVPLAIGWVLGVEALWLTLAVIVVSAMGWTGRHMLDAPPAFLQSLVTITLPWILVLSLLGLSAAHEFFGLHVALISLWTVHHWGEERSLRLAGDRLGLGLLLVADLGLGVLLIVAQTPLWLALLAILWLPTYLTLYQGKRADRLTFWWLAAMLLSSSAIGSRMLA